MDGEPLKETFGTQGAEWFWQDGGTIQIDDRKSTIALHDLTGFDGRCDAILFTKQDDAPPNTSDILPGGTRESRRLLGDVLLTQDDIVTKREFPDGCVPSTWSIDLHYPKKQYSEKFPDNPFISVAEHDRRIDRSYGFPIPYRCFYSRNIENLFMAGRCISVTHEALGTTRVMKTCGMMGEVVGRATSICVLRDCRPREVYTHYWSEMDGLLNLPGKAYRKTVHDENMIPDDALPLAGPYGPMTGLDPADLAGLVIDDRQAEKTGKWTEGTGLKGYVAWGYVYAGANTKASIRFDAEVPQTGRFEIRLAYQPHENRGSTVPVSIQAADRSSSSQVNMKQPPGEDGFVPLGRFELQQGDTISVVLSTENAGGMVHADAVAIVRVDK